ncbi:DUF1573 domain-containing protein [Ferruginibacter sp.]
MKKYFLFIVIPATLFSCDVKRKDKISDDSKTDSIKLVQKKQAEEDALKNTTAVQMIDSVYNFGTVADGEKVAFSFRFKNAGTNPLVIFDASATCGCTIPEKPEQPILPGETGFIKVVFNSSGKKGHNEKVINVTSNARPIFPPLKLIGEVK